MARGTRGAQDLLKNLSRHLPSSLEALHTEVTVGDRRAVTPGLALESGAANAILSARDTGAANTVIGWKQSMRDHIE